MALLGSPIFLDFAFYAILPNMLKLNTYKLALMAIITIMASILAIRVKGKILLIWAITILRYNARPRYHVFNKNNTHLRNKVMAYVDETETQATSNIKQAIQYDSKQLSREDIFTLECILADRLANLSFATNKKGGLHVTIAEIK
jgi:hypothetical protein